MRLVLNGNLPRSTLLKRIAFAASPSQSRSRSRSSNGFDDHHRQEEQQQQHPFEFYTGNDDGDAHDDRIIVGLPPNPNPPPPPPNTTGGFGTRNVSGCSTRSLVSSLGLHDHVEDEDYYSHAGDANSIILRCCDDSDQCHQKERGPEQCFQPCHCSSSSPPSSELWLVSEEEEEENGEENNDKRGIGVTTLHLVDWNFGTIHSDVIVAVQDFLKHETETKKNKKSLSFSSSSSSSSKRLLRNVIIEDCIGGECLQYFVVVVFQTVGCLDYTKQESTSLTIRYRKQRKMPPAIANGLYQGATEHGSGGSGTGRDTSSRSHGRRRSKLKLKSLRLEGMTLTPLTAQMIHVAIPLLKPYLRELSISGNFDLIDVDRKQTSIVGRYKPDMKESITWLRGILYQLSSCLQVLKLECCHIPDRFLADLLETINAAKIVSLKLKGNMVQEESLHMIHDILTSHGCKLQHLDVSWQRLPPPANYRGLSILPLGELAHAIGSSGANSLVSLDVSHNRLTDEDVVQMSLAVQRSSALQSLSMRHCRMSDRSMSAIAAVIPYLQPPVLPFRSLAASNHRDAEAKRHSKISSKAAATPTA